MNPKDEFKVVAIDGGAATGKSSTSRLLAEHLYWLHVDTGTHYRAVTLACVDSGISPVADGPLKDFLETLKLDTKLEGNRALIRINGRCPDEKELRSPEVNSQVSHFAAVPEVRDAVKSFQRSLVGVAKRRGFHGIVMDGRDIGSVILPDADLKVFLYADEGTRQLRRTGEGEADTVSERDRIDSSRATAPLIIPEGAFHIDNSNLDLEAVVRLILEKLGQAS